MGDLDADGAGATAPQEGQHGSNAASFASE